MRTEHMQQVERWASFVKNNPSKWKKVHTEFINALFNKHKNFVERLLQQSDGLDKVIKIYNIKNVKKYRKILNS